MKKWRLDPLEVVRNYSNYEIVESDTIILLTFLEKAYYQQNKRTLRKVKNISFDDTLMQITIHSLTPIEGEPENMSYNMRVAFSYKEEYCFWVYFDDERIRVFTMHKLLGLDS
ncbi:MAG: hypothetical protein V4538_08615 [Bacteroidota bacterium]